MPLAKAAFWSFCKNPLFLCQFSDSQMFKMVRAEMVEKPGVFRLNGWILTIPEDLKEEKIWKFENLKFTKKRVQKHRGTQNWIGKNRPFEAFFQFWENAKIVQKLGQNQRFTWAEFSAAFRSRVKNAFESEFEKKIAKNCHF